jgi:hypothetical protein
MNNISYQLSQTSLHSTHGISINFQHKYNYFSMHYFELTILILDITITLFFSPIWFKYLYKLFKSNSRLDY